MLCVIRNIVFSQYCSGLSEYVIKADNNCQSVKSLYALACGYLPDIRQEIFGTR